MSVLLHPLDYSNLPWILTLLCCVLSKAASSTIFESLVWLDLGLNPGLPNHWQILFSLGQCPVYTWSCILDWKLKLTKSNEVTRPDRLSNWWCHILHRWTNNEKHVDIWKYNLYFYSSTVTVVCSRNTVRESSHISFFCGGDPFCEVVPRLENTQEGRIGLLEWPVGLCLQSKMTDFVLSFQVSCRNMNILFASCIFLFIAGYWK